uniref:Uncharacterized protein n=1 Tax=Hanusia phi TaxID=3032 RepID=A0A7S0EMK6_9CRYP|mmetsp:Transcript_2790/g.6682  ORF Transcript_2790/g.6682 Transcript_2790/m.6682 type:complete len:207 (+) Transcript_2790:701-1321(+)
MNRGNPAQQGAETQVDEFLSRSLQTILSVVRAANGLKVEQEGNSNVLVLCDDDDDDEEEDARSSWDKQKARSSPDRFATQSKGRIGSLSCSLLSREGGLLEESLPDCPRLSVARTSSQEVARQVEEIIDAAPLLPLPIMKSLSARAEEHEPSQEMLACRKDRFGPNGATWRMTTSTRSASRLKACMAFDKDIGRHAPCLSPSPHLQ